MPFMEINNNKEKRIIYSYLAIFLIIGVFIAFGGYQYHKNFKKHFKANIENQLTIIADLKVSEIEHWLEEQRGNATALFKNKAFSNLIKRHLNSPNDSVINSEIQSWMKEFQTAFNYNAVIFTDPQLFKKIIIPEEPERPQAYISPGNIDSLYAGKIVFEDFYLDDFKQKIFLKLLVPILDVKKLIGIIEMRIDPMTYLYPILENWPLVSETSETIILRREGNKAVYLNELRFQKNSALNFSVSLEQTNVPAVRAVLGQEGFMEGIGYNGKDVVAHINKIPHSPWYMITKTDASEAYATLRKNLWLTVMFSFGIFLISGMSLGFLWRNQRIQIYKDRIKSDEALQKLNLAIYNSHEVVFLTDKEGTITYINPQFTNIYGYTAEEVVGVTTPRILNSGINKKEDLKSFWDALLNKQSIPATEYFNKCKDGKLVKIEGSANPIINNNGEIIGFLGMQRDITERKKAEENLAAERSLLRALIDNIPDRIYAKDTKSRFIICNSALVGRMGKSDIEEIIGKSDFDFLPYELASQYFTNEQEIILTGQPQINREESFRDFSDMEKWSLTTKVPLHDYHGNIIGIIGIGKDITDRKKAENEIKLKNDQLQTNNAEKDKFFSILAHDLRGPMSAFVGITELLTEDFQTMTPDQVKDLTSSMRTDASNIYKLLENLLEWSRLKRGMIDFKPEKHNLKNIINKGIEVISVSSRKKEIGINISVPDNLDCIVDEHMFETIVRNLVSNAVKFTPVGGKINVSAYLSQDNLIEIKISDTGIGMAPDLISKLFLLNEKTSRKGTEGEASTGLGLLLCKEFIEKLGGKIWVESEERKGSTFYFTIPY
jgi:PAS domain S-box-containing protein